MKMKSIFLAAAAALTLASCAKDEPAATAGNGKTNFVVSLPGAPSTYAVEDPQVPENIEPDYNDVTVWLVDGGNNVTAYAWTPAEITAKEKHFEQILEPAKVIVVANKGAADLTTGVATVEQLQDKLKTLKFEDQNTSLTGDNTVLAVTLYGEQTSISDEGFAPGDSHPLKKAAVELKSLVSRFEAGTLKAGTGLTDLSVEAVYLNYFYMNYGDSTAQRDDEATWTFTTPGSYTPPCAADAGSVDVNSQPATKAYAYQVFARDMVPHIIYQVSGTLAAGYQLPDGTTGAFTGKYVTVKGFKVGGKTLVGADTGVEADNYPMKAHEIYKMGLENGGIEITPDQITDKPEKEHVDLIVAITVAPWTMEEVTPEI